jgi:predicted RNase H-like nuclease (RuvC/YqgF family)
MDHTSETIQKLLTQLESLTTRQDAFSREIMALREEIKKLQGREPLKSTEDSSIRQHVPPPIIADLKPEADRLLFPQCVLIHPENQNQRLNNL